MTLPTDLRQLLESITGASDPRILDDLEVGIEGDPLLLHHLLVAKDDPQMLHIVLESVASDCRVRVQGEVPPFQREDDARPASERISSVALAGRAAGALLGWARDGFRHASAQEVARRLAVCATCPHRRRIRMDGMYRFLSSLKEDDICTLCGCVLRRKAALESESCPDAQTGPAGRWASE